MQTIVLWKVTYWDEGQYVEQELQTEPGFQKEFMQKKYEFFAGRDKNSDKELMIATSSILTIEEVYTE